MGKGEGRCPGPLRISNYSVITVKFLLNAGSQINAGGSDVRVLMNAGARINVGSPIDAQTIRTHRPIGLKPIPIHHIKLCFKTFLMHKRNTKSIKCMYRYIMTSALQILNLQHLASVMNIIKTLCNNFACERIQSEIKCYLMLEWHSCNQPSIVHCPNKRLYQRGLSDNNKTHQKNYLLFRKSQLQSIHAAITHKKCMNIKHYGMLKVHIFQVNTKIMECLELP